MEYSFPPPPPGYAYTIIARVILALWAVIGLGILVHRVRHWNSIQAKESAGWTVAAVLSCIVAVYGYSHRTIYDNNAWLLPTFFGALAVATAGVAACWGKLFMERNRSMEKVGGAVALVGMIWLSIGAEPFVTFAILPLGHPAEAHHRTECRNNLKQVGLALHNYHDDSRAFPPAANGTPAHSWRVAILPFLDQRTIYGRYQRGQEWNSAANLPLAGNKVSVFVCPTSFDPQDSASRWYSAYSMPTGKHSVGANPRGTSLGEITDGSSHTLLVVEACGAQIVWTEPRDVNIQTQPVGINLNGSSPGQSAGWLSSYHSHGAQALLGDGSVRFLSSGIDQELLQKLATIDGGEYVYHDY